MPEDLTTPARENNTGGGSTSFNPDEDGRSKEWQDRSRVNLEQVPEGVHTNIERDFEPENPEEKSSNKEESKRPAY